MAINTNYKSSYNYWTPPPANNAPSAPPASSVSPPPQYSADEFNTSPPYPYPSGNAPAAGGAPPSDIYSSEDIDKLAELVADLSDSVDKLCNVPSGMPGSYENGPPMATDGRAIPQKDDKRPEGDLRTPGQIVDASPALSHLGRQKDIHFDQLCQQTGVDPKLDVRDPKQNPDAVYRLAKVLDFIDAPSLESGNLDGKMADGSISGLHEGGNAEHGTEAGMVKDFAEQGYEFLNRQYVPAPANNAWGFFD